MAHFAEIDNNGKVLRVVVACNKDIADNGGEQSEEASKYFETYVLFQVKELNGFKLHIIIILENNMLE